MGRASPANPRGSSSAAASQSGRSPVISSPFGSIGRGGRALAHALSRICQSGAAEERGRDHPPVSQGELLRHLPTEDIGEILPLVEQRSLPAGEIVFRAGEEGDALYIVARGKVDVTEGGGADCHSLAELGPGRPSARWRCSSGAPRTATIQTAVPTDLLVIKREDFRLADLTEVQLAAGATRLSHERAIRNLSKRGDHPEVWARVARDSLGPVSQRELRPPPRRGGEGRGAGDRLREYPGHDPRLPSHRGQIRPASPICR